MSSASPSLEDIIGASSRSLVIGIGGGGDVAGALATARFLEFCGLEFVLGGLVIRVYIRMKFSREPAIRLFDIVRFSVFLNAEYLVVVFLSCHFYSVTS